MYNALLMLQGGKTFYGKSLGFRGISAGEVCFTTGITGYQHTITDPSFAHQIITFTFPHIGNVGVNDKDYERKEIFARGIIVREDPTSNPFHPSSNMSLQNWLEKNKIIGIYGIDTRALTQYIREHGSINGVICSEEEIDLEKVEKYLASCPGMKGRELSMEIAKTQGNINDCTNKVDKTIVIVDFGMKAGIAKQLADMKVIIVPAREDFAISVISHKPDGIVFSNGPGDPSATAKYASVEINKLLDQGIPIFAICLGHQLLAITLGCKTIKMKAGHRGANHPVYDLQTKKVEISSQNHGFVIDGNVDLPDEVEITHKSLFDGSIEGIKMKNKPVFSVQYHPEGSPGPHDSHYLFQRFIDEVMHK